MAEPRSITGEAEAVRQPGTYSLWRTALHDALVADWGDVSGYFFILPAVVMFLVFNAWPIIRGLTIAFQDYRFLYVGWHPFNGIDNLREMVADKVFWESFSRSAYFFSLYVPATVILSLGVATLIANVWNPFAANVYRTIAYLPVILPIAVAMLLWKHLFNSNFGYLNYAINSVLGKGVAPSWTSDPKWVIPAMVISTVWKRSGYDVLLFLVGLYNINHELYEAAALDGAGAWRQFIYITLPLLRPVLVLTLVLSAGVIGVTTEPMVWFPTTAGIAGPQDSALTVGYYAYKLAFLYGDLRWGYAAAMNLTLGVLSMVIAAVVFRALGRRD